ncbi:MAG: DEAD/DEAH box helicase [Propionibacteriaceae bacterium]|jgi:hypothetical protein|nr:DEAD/DEAH box helicase [Propionibacteriaceae bacterium]
MLMDVLHALWRPGCGLALWGEDAARSVTSPSQALRVARPHPFAVPAAELQTIAGGTADDLVLALPSLFKAPCDSPELARLRQSRAGRPRPAAEPGLRAWRLPVTILAPGDAHRFLTADRSEADDPLAEVRLAPSVAFFQSLATFATELVGRGRYVPAIVRADDQFRARWRPLLQGPDAAFAAQAATGMPPAVRAVVENVDDTTGLNPAWLVLAAVTDLVDALVRETCPPLADKLPRPRGRQPVSGRPVEAWLDALTGDPVIAAPAPDILALAKALEPWDKLGAAASAASLVIRLREPAPAGGADAHGDTPDWTLDFALQSAADPSLVVEAAQIWQGTSGLERWLQKPDQTLLAELARASALYPPIAAALRQAAPTCLTLADPEALSFLTTVAPRLDQAGIVVHLPGWWARRPRLGLKGHATPGESGGVTAGMLTADTLYTFTWQFALDGVALTDEEMEALVEAKTPLVQLRGQWVAYDPERVRRGLAYLREARQRAEQWTAGEIVTLALGQGTATVPYEIESCTADGPLGRLLDGTVVDTLQLLEPPGWFTATLRPYQSRGLAWLAFLARLGLGACLADDMGLGKTMQVLALEAVERAARPADALHKPTLVVCPVSLVSTWQREAARFAPDLRVAVHYGPDRCHGDDLTPLLTAADLVVTTYQVLLRDLDDLAGRDWHRVVIDEAQNVKNSETHSARAVARLRAEQRVALTGTPVENKLAELRSILNFCNPGFLGSPESFRTTFATPIERRADPVATERLQAVTRPFILRRLKTDRTIIDDLPNKIETKQTCFLTPEQASLYQAVVDDMMGQIEAATGIERRGLVLAALTKLKQICNHPAQFLHDASPIGRRSGKLARLDAITDEILAEGGRALIFTQYTEFGDLLVRHLGARFGVDAAYLHGGVPKRRRDELVAEFQSEAGPPLFVLSLKAGGTGLTLTAANHVIHVDRWWNPAVENQATDRAFRIGQKRTVQVHTFVTAGTLEERIDAMIEQKKALANLVVGDGEGWLTELSTAELREVVALSKEALGE